MHKTTKENRSASSQSFKLYCFPDLSEECGVGTFVDPEKAMAFKRIDSKNNKSAPKPFSFGMAVEDGKPGDDGIVAVSREDIADIEKTAYTDGYAKGEKAGLELGNRQLTPVIDNFGQALTELDNVKKKIYLNAEKKTLDLAMAIARKIVSHEIQSNRDVLLSIIQEALERVVDNEDITIKLNPEDFKYINDSKQALRNMIDQYANITFKADASITGGGCLIETKMGEIDARIDRQFKVIEELFDSEFQKTRGEAE